MMLISISELKDQLLRYRQQQQQSSSNMAVGTRDHFQDKTQPQQLSQAFLNSLVHSVGPVSNSNNDNNNNSAAAGAAAAVGGAMFPSIVGNTRATAIAVSATGRGSEEDEDPAISAAWAKHQNRAKKSRKVTSSSR